MFSANTNGKRYQKWQRISKLLTNFSTYIVCICMYAANYMHISTILPFYQFISYRYHANVIRSRKRKILGVFIPAIMHTSSSKHVVKQWIYLTRGRFWISKTRFSFVFSCSGGYSHQSLLSDFSSLWKYFPDYSETYY